MRKTLVRICELQKHYSSANTPEMLERGKLIRGELTGELRFRLPRLQSSFDSVFDDLAVEGSDGIGRKTEAPWVRLFSKTMSPNAREGFYIVIHFAADGSAVFFTIGCGSTVWSGGDLRPVSDAELQRRTDWARRVVESKWGALDPFIDEILLGAAAPLPKTFEKATAIAKRILVHELNDHEIDQLLLQASERLSEIYLAQLEHRDVSQGDQDVEEIAVIAKPLRKVSKRRQGMGLTGPERKAVELRAMNLATEYLAGLGYACKDTSATESYDILAKHLEGDLKIEVKGTTSDLCDSVLMTRNEVELHRTEKGRTGLIVVSKIKIRNKHVEPVGEEGVVEALLCWDIDTWTSEAIAFQVTRK